MALYWLSGQDPDETGFFQVDWTDEMDAAGDTITGTPTFASTAGAAVGLTFASIAIATGSKKVNVLISNSDPSANRAAALAASPITDIVHTITTTAGQTLVRTLSLVIAEDGSDLTVEDGSVVSGADTYGSLAAADLYHTEMGNSGWTGTDLERARMLRRGTAALDNRYRTTLKGGKTTSGQDLVWPRLGMADEDGNNIASDTIPTAVQRAAFEMARAIKADQTATMPARVKSAGAGSARVEFATAIDQRSVLSIVDELMRPYVTRSNKLVRA